MPDLTRYGIVAHDDGSDRMEPVANGQWVKAAEAAAAIERLDHECHTSMATIASERARAEAAEATIERLLAESCALVEALTPSGDTKAAYIGEFKFDVEVWDPDGGEDGDGEAVMQSTTVPWTTVKEIMAAISTRARQALQDSKT